MVVVLKPPCHLLQSASIRRFHTLVHRWFRFILALPHCEAAVAILGGLLAAYYRTVLSLIVHPPPLPGCSTSQLIYGVYFILRNVTLSVFSRVDERTVGPSSVCDLRSLFLFSWTVFNLPPSSVAHPICKRLVERQSPLGAALLASICLGQDTL
jgi:hypothetical protein